MTERLVLRNLAAQQDHVGVAAIPETAAAALAFIRVLIGRVTGNREVGQANLRAARAIEPAATAMRGVVRDLHSFQIDQAAASARIETTAHIVLITWNDHSGGQLSQCLIALDQYIAAPYRSNVAESAAMSGRDVAGNLDVRQFDGACA